jgi:D-glycero-D-manno-heptose 1,7-bisphosphate phosphatase
LRQAIFFDRDGTLVVEVGYLNHPSLVAPYRVTPEALRKAREAGFLLICVTNQSGVARGYVTECELDTIHRRMEELLERSGVSLDAIYYCPHHPWGVVEQFRRTCDCRKPAPGMGLEAARRFDIDLNKSFMIGDKDTDLLFGAALGAESCLVRTGMGAAEEKRLGPASLADYGVFDDVLEAVDWIVGQKDNFR